MTPQARCIPPDTTLADAATIMDKLNVGALPICDHDRLTGMLTDRDIVVRAVARGRDPQSTTARDAMTEGIVYVYEDEDAGEAARVFESKQIRRLPVLNREKRMVGIVSLGDLAVGGGVTLGGEALKEISEHPASARQPAGSTR